MSLTKSNKDGRSANRTILFRGIIKHTCVVAISSIYFHLSAEDRGVWVRKKNLDK